MTLEKIVLKAISESTGFGGKRIANAYAITEAEVYRGLLSLRKKARTGSWEKERLDAHDLARGLCPSRVLWFIEKEPGHENKDIAEKLENCSNQQVHNHIKKLKELKDEEITEILENHENLQEFNRLMPLFELLKTSPGISTLEIRKKMNKGKATILQQMEKLDKLKGKVEGVEETLDKHRAERKKINERRY